MPALNTLARAVTLALAVAPGAVCAGQFDYSLYAGIEHSNNIALSTDNPVSANVLIPGLNFSYLQQGSTFQANVAGTLEYHDYLGSQFDNQTQTQLVGQANWTVLPQRLDFTVQDYAGVQPVDSLASNSPDNQQQTNVLTVGPTLHLRFGDAMTGQVELRYINSYASKIDDFNSSRGMAAGRLYRDLSPTDQLSFNVETQRVTFDNSAADSNYTRNEAFVRYTSKLVKFDADVLVGWSQLKFNSSPDASKPLARVTIGWEPTVRSGFSISGAYQYADAAQDLSQPVGAGALDTQNIGVGTGGTGVGGNGISTGNVVIDSQVYLEKLVQATYTFTSERLTLSVSPEYRNLHYINDGTFDQTGRGGTINLGYRLRPTLTLSAFVTGEKVNYQTLTRHDKTIRVGLNLSRQWTPHWSWNASLSRERRNSDAVNQSYRETQIFFGVVYRR